MSQTKSAKAFLNNTMFRRGGGTRPVKFHAYDLETTLIPQHDIHDKFPEKSTPEVLYITGYSEHQSGLDRSGEPIFSAWQISEPVKNITNLKEILTREFLTDEKLGNRFVAWNANNFDVYFIGAALLDTDYIIRPYITKSHAVRGLKIVDPENNKRSWEFLDGISMTGITAKLRDFIKAFAPEFAKLDLNFAGGVEFDSTNPDHRAYALRDSVGLYHALIACDRVVEDLTDGMHLTPTVGNLGIKFFQKMMPKKTYVRRPNKENLESINYSLKRGGYCYLNRRYRGPTWKYDINQAYASAMRDCNLPSGRMRGGVGIADHDEAAMYRIKAETSNTDLPPFYWKHSVTSKAEYSRKISDAWITSDELTQIKKEGWIVEIFNAYFWDTTFNMEELVNHLEVVRMSDPQGPSGPIGTMCKSLGNNAYGKTAEQLDGEELLMARDCPQGYKQWNEGIDHIWSRTQDAGETDRGYHQPQIASFITAYVRMEVRRAILKNPTGWIYADTDCVAFDSPTDLPIDKKIYGKWKQETDGEVYSFIVKKGYFSQDKTVMHCKGMNIKNADGTLKFSDKELEKWWKGEPPEQSQTHRKNFLKFISTGEMYHGRKKIAQKIVKKSIEKKK